MNLNGDFFGKLEGIKSWVRESVKYRPSFTSLWQTTSFKVALTFAGLFSGFALLLLLFIYASTVWILSYDADRAARRELSELTDVWYRGGVNNLNRTIIQRAATNSDSLYVLITPQGTVLSGNIDAVPMDLSQVNRPETSDDLRAVPVIARGFTYFRGDDARRQRGARGVFVAGPDGYGLFVARDLGPGFVLAERIVSVVWFGSLAVLALSVIGGYWVARGASRRVDELSKTTEAVMAGNLAIRAPTRVYKSGAGDEFDRLTQDLNSMLDRTEKLVQSSRTIGDSIAHDLRSPLTRLRANLENASHHSNTQEDLHLSIENAIVELDSIVTTFNAVLRLSRLEAGEGGNFKVFNLSEVLEELVDLYEPSITEKGLKFSSEISTDLLIKADKSLLFQAFANIVDNAIKYTSSGRIEISAKSMSGNKIEIAVQDTGPGIPASERENAKKRFVRLDGARSTPGNGIGLSLSQAIAEAHSGNLILGDGLPTRDGVGLKVSLVLGNGM
jgi:hypothetical protein